MKTVTIPKRSGQVLPQRAKIGTALTVVDQEPEVPGQARNLMEVISRASQDPNVNVDKLEKLLSLYERISSRDAEQRYNVAMADAQSEMRPVAQDASNPQTKSKYASYHALDQALRPIYTKHGFALSFDTAEGAGELMVRVVCKVSHREGHSERPHLDMPADGKGARGGDVMTKTHATMSAVSYAKRGLLKMIFNIAEGDDTDDDGNAAGNVPIDAVQLQNLRDLLERTKSDPELFCRHFKIEAVPDLPLKDFPRAVEMLNAKARPKQ